MEKHLKRVCANIIIFLSLLMMARAQFDSNNYLAQKIFKIVTPIQNYFSMWRGWQMFAPNPLRINSFISAKVVTKDKVIEFEFPGPKSKDFMQSYFIGERFRKYMVEGVRLDKNKHLWKDTALWVFRKFKEIYPNEEVRNINLYRNWSHIPPWDEYFIPHRKESKIKVKNFKFYTYKVKEGKGIEIK
tara:strand:+ start:70107 stop:70667 length:561 start_codon:yes stop_codon:yes gene_type:complete